MQVFFLKPSKGIIEWNNLGAVHQYLLDNDGKELYAKFDKVKSVRSLDQNAYYWMYLGVIARETGNNEDDLHRIFKGRFLPKEKVIFKGKEYTMSGSTTKLSKSDFGIYLDKICAETEIALPERLLASVAYPQSTGDNKSDLF